MFLSKKNKKKNEIVDIGDRKDKKDKENESNSIQNKIVIRRKRKKINNIQNNFDSKKKVSNKEMIIRETKENIQVSVLEDNILVEHLVSIEDNKSIIGNIYYGIVENVLPSMDTAFVNIGLGKNAVIYSGEVNWDGAEIDEKIKKPKISDALKKGNKILVQVTKDPITHKGARLTSQISLSGKYVYFMPEIENAFGISKRVPTEKREHIKEIIKTMVPEKSSAIARSSTATADDEEIVNDVAALITEWEEIKKKIKETKKAPSLIKKEPNLGVKAIRDIFTNEFKKIYISGNNEYELTNKYIKKILPKDVNKLEKWTNKTDVFVEKKIDQQLAKALDRKVYLPSGGSLVFDRTEAMTVVDVNTGKFVGDGTQNLESTVTANNLEAAEELIRQLRLRDIGGIIVIDFIDMVQKSNKNKVLDKLIECLSNDRTRYQVTEFTPVGLVQITRKKIGTVLIEAFSKVCEYCDGRGYNIRSKPVKKINTTDADFNNTKSINENVNVIDEKSNADKNALKKMAGAMKK